MDWSPQQNEALETVRRWLDYGTDDKQVFRLFGYAGTGKTTLAIEIAQMCRGRVLFAAFTGKAALVMSRKGCTGARTIHSLIYKPAEDMDDDERQKNGGELKFILNRDSDLNGAQLLIVDECSMVGEELARDLLSFRVPVLVLGDPAQLPPVKGAGFFTEAAPDVMLTEVHRQAEGNPIIRIATLIRTGGALERGNHKGEQPGHGVSIMLREALKEPSMLAADQILCGKNDTRCSLNRRMRSLLRREGKLGPHTVSFLTPKVETMPVEGDRVICLKNKRETGLLNGGIWTVNQILDRMPNQKKPGRDDISYLVVDSQDDGRAGIPVAVPNAFWFWNTKPDTLNLHEDIRRREIDEFDYAYCVTCHKSQGSQWNKVIVMDESSVFARNGQEEMGRRWLYTATTRAAEALIIAV